MGLGEVGGGALDEDVLGGGGDLAEVAVDDGRHRHYVLLGIEDDGVSSREGKRGKGEMEKRGRGEEGKTQDGDEGGDEGEEDKRGKKVRHKEAILCISYTTHTILKKVRMIRLSSLSLLSLSTPCTYTSLS